MNHTLRACTTALGVVAVAWILVGSRTVSAQMPDNVTISQIDASKFPLLTLYVTVNDDQGNAIRGLEKGTFTVTEDGRSVGDFSLSTVEEESPPLTLAVALDVSESMKGQALADAKAAAKEFIDGLSAKDRVALLSFGSQVSVVQDFTSDKTLLKSKIDGLQATGTTALYDAIHQSASRIASEQGRKGFVVLTDGWNYQGGPRTLGEAREAALAAKAPGYALGFGSAHAAALEPLAVATGGQFLRRPAASQVRDLFRQLSGQLKSQYVISYPSTIQPDSKDHVVSVEVAVNGITAGDSRSFVAIPVQTVATVATVAPVVRTPMPVEEDASGRTGLAALGLILLAVGIGALLFALLRRRLQVRYCPTCGRLMDPSWTQCLFCAQGAVPTTAMANDQTLFEDEVPGLAAVAPVAIVESQPTRVLRQQPQAMAWLIMTQGPDRGREFRLNAGETMLGRATDSDIALDDTAVSRFHAKIRHEGEDYYVYDMGATNPTRVNGAETVRHKLAEGDRIEVGGVILTFMRVE
jgi:VWFA-related protein